LKTEKEEKILTPLDALAASLLFWNGLSKYLQDFTKPLLKAGEYFTDQEADKFLLESPDKNIRAYLDLAVWNWLLFQRACASVSNEFLDYYSNNFLEFTAAVLNGNDDIAEMFRKKRLALQKLVVEFPDAVKKIREDYGFHFDSGGYLLIEETERMRLYQVLPDVSGVQVNNDMKPVIIAHPFVLGPNILAFLPKERRSFVHAFANKGIPTYVRIIKEIDENPPVQVMTGEDDVTDTALFVRLIAALHGKPVTLIGVCQGGFMLLAGLLTGKYAGFVDALITCASPIDGTLSKGLKGYLDKINERFRDLAYSLKTLPSGNSVVDGDVMSWLYKLKSIEHEGPIYSFIKDLERFEKKGSGEIDKSAAAINYWLMYDRTDLPVEITNLSTLSYSVPISPQGDLPFTLFGRRLNLKYINEQNIKFLICYGSRDELVEPPSALAPLEYIRAQTAKFPSGHAAIFTSWSNPDSEYALDKQYADGSRGPVRFHLDLDEEISHKKQNE
jgi:hypothetical protein